MKALLKFIAECQMRQIADITQKKDAARLGNVAGVNLGGDLHSSEYEELLKNTNGFMKEARGFKEDSSKIILEKNSTFRLLEFSGLIFFRKLDENNETEIVTTKKCKNNIQYDAGMQFILSMFFFIPYALLMAGYENSTHTATVGLIITTFFFLLFLIHSIRKHLRCVKWLKNDSNKPEELFAQSDSPSNEKVDIRLTVDISGNDSTGWYTRALRETTVLAAKLKSSSLGWMWHAKPKHLLEDNYKMKPFFVGQKEGIAMITIGNNSDNLLLFIETEYSLIFSFPENYSYNGGINAPMIDSEREMIEKVFEEEKEKMFLTY